MAVVNPFQQINASLPPLAPPPLGFNPDDMNTSAPTQLPQGKRPQVFGPTPQDRQETMLGGRLEQDYQKDLHPWGTPENHPGTGGKIAHVFSTIGNIAGDIAAPRAMGRIPGTQAHRQQEESDIESKLSKLSELQSQNSLRGAQTGNLQSETADRPAKDQSEENLQTATAGEADARTDAMRNPPEEWKAIPQVIGPNGEPVEIEGRSGKVRFGDISGLNPQKQPKPDTPEQQYIDEYQRMHKGATVAAAERAYTTDTQRPPQSIMLIPGANGGYTAQNVKPGSQVAPGAISTGGLNTIDTPTTTQRTAAGRAETVIGMAPEVIQRINDTASQMGPVAGRWNEFMQGKVGAPNQAMADLRADLMMLSTAVALAHAQGRLPENLRQEFDNAINAPQQTPENLKGTIQTIIPWLQKMQEQGHGDHVGSRNQEPARPANVPDGYTFNANGPKGAGWYAPTTK